MRKKKGFTLIELLAVIAILAIILVISVPLVISNIDKGKQKSYDNQITLFVDGAKRYALEFNNELDWNKEKSEIENVKMVKITLQELANKAYIDLPVINPKTGKEFPPGTVIRIYKYPNGDYEFEYEDDTKARIMIGNKEQYILRKTNFDNKMIMGDVQAVDNSGKDITSSVTYTCKYKKDENTKEDVECSELAKESKQLGTYTITYSVNVDGTTKVDTKDIIVVEESAPTIEVSPEDTGVKVDRVRVTIVYPNGSKNNTYSSKSVSGGNYKGSFEINENQTITASCIDKYGLSCKNVSKTISHIKPTIEGEIIIAADWPNATSMNLALSGVKSSKEGTTIEYKCKVGTKETAWSESPTCNITGLTEGTAYTVVAYARNKDNTMDVIEKKPVTIYTAKMVKVETKTLAGTCPTNNNIAVAETDIYEAATVTGTCSQTMGSTKVSSKITNSEACGAAKTLTYTYSGTTYSGTTTSTCTATSSSCISKTSYYACSRSSWSEAGCSTLSYYACSRSSWSAAGCTSTQYYTCNKSVWSASGCSQQQCKQVQEYYACSVQVVTGSSTVYTVTSTCTQYGSCARWTTSNLCLTSNNTPSYCSSLASRNNTCHGSTQTVKTCSTVHGCSGYLGEAGCTAYEWQECGSSTVSTTVCTSASIYSSCISSCGKTSVVSSCATKYLSSSSCGYETVGSNTSRVCRTSYYTNTCVEFSYTITSSIKYIYGSILSSQGCTRTVCSYYPSYYGCSVTSTVTNGCSRQVSSGCSVLINSASGCSKYVSSGCNVLINSASGCSTQVCGSYKSYYTTTYEATISYPTTYTVTYKTVLVKPKVKIY